MKLLVCVVGLVVFTAGAYANETVQFNVCEDSYCYETVGDCARPNVKLHGNFMAVNAPVGESTTDCYCFCGREAGEQCSRDEECMEGYGCVITKEHAENTIGQVTHGVCTDRCKIMSELAAWEGGCSPYEKCVLEGKTPVCKTRAYKCATVVTDMMVEGEREVAGVKDREVFNSPCDMFKANYELQSINPYLEGGSLFAFKRFLNN